MPERRKTKVAGIWIHPADGDNYPTELTMRVTESSGGMGVIAWSTVTTGHPDGFGPYEHSFTFGHGAHSIWTSSKTPGGKWSPVRSMDKTRWGVWDGAILTARERLHEFFTELGYSREETR
jgi:hypothetical protein